jgi:pyrroloquinoline-quinone synthase
MKNELFWLKLEAKIKKYDLLCHPYYQAWSKGELTKQDLAQYASQYYHHVERFPKYLEMLSERLPESPLKRTVMKNHQEEQGHDLLWLDFVEGMGAKVSEVKALTPIKEIVNLMDIFEHLSLNGSPVTALAAYFAYESQVPRIAEEKEKGLRAHYLADDQACGYFTLHQTADLYHSAAWHHAIDAELETYPAAEEEALNAAELAASSLWQALDGIETIRKAKELISI